MRCAWVALLLVLLLTITACSNKTISGGPSEASISPSTLTFMYRADAARTGFYQGNTIPNFSHIQWNFDSGSEMSRLGVPSITKGVVYCGTGGKGFYAIDLQNGEEKWKFEEALASSFPAVVKDTVYFSTATGTFYALNTNGEVKWTFKGPYSGSIASSPALTEGMVVYGYGPGFSGQGGMCALDQETGEQRWVFSENGLDPTSPAIAEGKVVFVSVNGSLYGIELRTGKKVWRFPGQGYTRCVPAIAEGLVFFGVNDKDPFAKDAKGIFYAISLKDGQKVWERFLDSPVVSSAAVSTGIVCFGCADGTLYALDTKTGQEKWRFQTIGEMGEPSIVGTKVLVPGGDAQIHVLDLHSGKELAKSQVKLDVIFGPVYCEGWVIVSDTKGVLHAFH